VTGHTGHLRPRTSKLQSLSTRGENFSSPPVAAGISHSATGHPDIISVFGMSGWVSDEGFVPLLRPNRQLFPLCLFLGFLEQAERTSFPMSGECPVSAFGGVL
jgi:hypothetical protein